MTSPARGLPDVLARAAESRTVGLLLESRIPARITWVAPDGTPRVAPMWFSWTGDRVVVSSFAGAHKLRSLVVGAAVALCIDTDDFPCRSITIQGVIDDVRPVTGLTEEYRAAAVRYLGAEMGPTWCASLPAEASQVRIAIRPTSAVVVDMVRDLPFFAGPGGAG